MHLSVLPRYSVSLCLFLLAQSTAIRVAPTSPCRSVCGDATITNNSDIVCGDSDFANTPTGRAFHDCITCELNSTSFDPASGQTDLSWLLYNLRYELSYCIWGYPDAVGVGSTPCTTTFACAIFQSSIETDHLSANASTFEYCSGFNTEDIGQCRHCLQEVDNEFYLSNFFTVLEAGCSQKPADGQKLTLAGSVFSTNSIRIVNASASLLSTMNSGHSGPLDLGAKVGIAAAGVVLILIASGCFIVGRGKRRRRAFLATRHRPSPSHMIQAASAATPERKHALATGAPMPPPSLQTRNFDWQRPDKYPTLSPDDHVSGSERYFANHYSSLCSSPESGSEGSSSAIAMNQVHPWVGGGLGDGSHVGRMAMVREQSGDDIELQRMEHGQGGQ